MILLIKKDVGAKLNKLTNAHKAQCSYVRMQMLNKDLMRHMGHLVSNLTVTASLVTINMRAGKVGCKNNYSVPNCKACPCLCTRTILDKSDS